MPTLRAVLFDFGGVLSTSPFVAFNRYEREHGLPADFLRRVNATNPHDNAWSRLERGEVDMDAFDARFRSESTALGHEVSGRDVLALLAGDIVPEMIDAVRACRTEFKTGLLTNNFVGMGGFGGGPRNDAVGEVLALFDVVVESSQVGVRKPDPRFYEMACEQLEVEAKEAVFLDDLGVNLKPAAAMGMTTIKVVSPDQALADLETATGLTLR
ncbi:MAG TPA: HAD-IA family hydrolase [Acidimicrobiales bacterium]|jgi:putative hydrolase of the HAD superfamily|nr:HAD-IA family hydrolase [Acidimicrobiales bacterium]